jgi:hypothetical protein
LVSYFFSPVLLPKLALITLLLTDDSFLINDLFVLGTPTTLLLVLTPFLCELPFEKFDSL